MVSLYRVKHNTKIEFIGNGNADFLQRFFDLEKGMTFSGDLCYKFTDLNYISKKDENELELSLELFKKNNALVRLF